MRIGCVGSKASSSMSIDFSSYSREIQEAHKKVLDASDSTNWAVFGYGPQNELKVTGTGG
jgi:hypothetical protein